MPVLVFSPRVKSSLLGIDCIPAFAFDNPAETNPSVSPAHHRKREREKEMNNRGKQTRGKFSDDGRIKN